MIGLIFTFAFASFAADLQEQTQPERPSRIDPKFEVVPGPFKRVLPSDRDSRLTTDEKGRCYFIATRPVKPGPDQAIVRDIPSTPPIDNMPVVKPGPTCSNVR